MPVMMRALCLLFLLSISLQGMAEEGKKMKKAVFAGGCFWCMEPAFENKEGVEAVVSGYSGGRAETATYQHVSTGQTNHYEAVEVTYNPDVIAYEALVEEFWYHIDPYDKEGQFADKGRHYQTAIFYANAEEKEQAEASKARLAAKYPERGPIYTRIEPLGAFYPAESEHQGYAAKNPMAYKLYKWGSGRVQRLKDIWGGKE